MKLGNFGAIAKSLSRNPLGIIALFIVLIYGFASLVVGASDSLQSTEKLPIVWFLVVFPLIVLGVFGWLVSCHNEKLYAPEDYERDESFLQAISKAATNRGNLHNLEEQIDRKIKDIMITEEGIKNILEEKNIDMSERIKKVADTLTNEIKKSTFITIDLSDLTNNKNDSYEFPINAFGTFGALTNEVFFKAYGFIQPYTYGISWILKNKNSDKIFKSMRVIKGIGPGIPVDDERSLSEVGIYSDMTLEAKKINK